MPALVGHRARGSHGMRDAEMFLNLDPNGAGSTFFGSESGGRSRKRARVSAPYYLTREEEYLLPEAKKPMLLPCRSLDELPDECLFEILRRLSGDRERCSSSGVSKRWLGLLSSIRPSEISTTCSHMDVSEHPIKAAEFEEGGEERLLDRCLEGEEATDVRLSAMAVAASLSGGVTKLSLRGAHPTRGVTDNGLEAIARGSPSLRALYLWDVPLITDAGLSYTAAGCPLLEELDITRCPLISDKGLIEVANKCPNLISLTLESCIRIGNEGLKMIGRLCPNLKSITLKNCPRVGDQGVSSIIYFSAASLEKIKIQALNITDASLAVIGLAGKAITDLALTRLQFVGERGFWVMANAAGLQMLRRASISACPGITDTGLVSLARCCPSLKQLCLQKSPNISDAGIKGFTDAAKSLESLQLEECHAVTLIGVLGCLFNCGPKFRSLALVKCMGIKDIATGPERLPLCSYLRSLTICGCPGLTDASLEVVGRICPQLANIELSGLVDVTDNGILPLVESSEYGLEKVNLSGCVNITDAVVTSLVKAHGRTLKVLNLDGCKKITDSSLSLVADNCSKLVELDVSKSMVSDYGVAILASARQLDLHLLSLSGCVNVTQKSVRLLSNMAHSLEGLNLQYCNLINHGVVSLEENLWWCDILA